MKILKKYAWYGVAVVASLAVALSLLLVGPADRADALASSNNLETAISLDTNVATGSSTFTTLPPITIVCDMADINPGVANGTTGITLTLSAGWTFSGGVAPFLVFDPWGAADADAFAAIASPTSITYATLVACGQFDVVTITGVQVKPLTVGSASGTITADIATADVTVARLTAVAGVLATKVRVETAADGSGTVVGSQTVAARATVTGYAISRTAADVFVANVAGTWSLTSKAGGVADGDLVPAGDAKSAIFTGHLAGTGIIHVTSGALTPGDSGTLTVTVPTPTAVPTAVPTPALNTASSPPPPASTPTPAPAVPAGPTAPTATPLAGAAGGVPGSTTGTGSGGGAPAQAPAPAATGNAGTDGVTSPAAVWLLGIATVGLVLAGRRLVSRWSAR